MSNSTTSRRAPRCWRRARSFQRVYAHWAGGAGPDLLLGDLKSQLDLLAVKLSKQ